MPCAEGLLCNAASIVVCNGWMSSLKAPHTAATESRSIKTLDTSSLHVLFIYLLLVYCSFIFFSLPMLIKNPLAL